MKKMIIISIFISMLSCVNTRLERDINKLTTVERDINKLPIVKIEQAKDYFVFTVKNKEDKNLIVLGEIGKLKGCKPFKKYVLLDSIDTAPSLKVGNKIVYIGFNGLTEDGIKLKESGQLAKIIANCKSFTD